jgi:ATP-dependent DNA ligase
VSEGRILNTSESSRPIERSWRRGVSTQKTAGVKAPFPGFIEPALASSIEKVPSGERWMHEIKFDGYRVQVHLINQAVNVFPPVHTILNISNYHLFPK